MATPHLAKKTAQETTPLVPAVVRAAALMDTLARQRQPMSMARLAAALGLPRSSVHGLCNTLVTLGYLRRDHDGQLAIGPRVMTLAEAFVASTHVAREFDALWQGLGQQPDDTVLLSVLDGHDVLYMAVRHGASPLGLAFSVGLRLPAHATATGKAMLAQAPPEWVQHWAAGRSLARLTERSPANLDSLQAELAETRARGYSVDDEGVRLGVLGVAAAVLDAAGQTVAAVGISLNKALLQPQTIATQGQQVVATARSLSQRLGGNLPGTLAAPELLQRQLAGQTHASIRRKPVGSQPQPPAAFVATRKQT